MSALADLPDLSPAVEALLQQAQRSERSGRRELSRQYYESALYLLRKDETHAASSILRRIARSYGDDGEFDVALDCSIAALAVAEASGDAVIIATAINSMAVVHLQRGDLDRAKELFADAHAAAAPTDADRLKAMIAQNLGIIASTRGDFHAALDHYGSALLTFRAAGLGEYVGPLLNNMGLDFTRLDRLDEAQAAYEEAIVQCAASGDTPHRLLALSNSIDLWLARGEISRAMSMCRTLLDEAAAARDFRTLGETQKHLGVIARMRGELGEAEQHLADAYENANRREDLLLAAETAREQAELYERMGKNKETLQALSLSHRLFTGLRAQHNLSDLQKRIARLETRFYHLVTRWAQTIESKDAYTLGHCERVADYACALARDVGFDDITMFWFRIGALLHDVGKIVVPSEILNKPGRFTPEEREIMERHAAAGSDLLRDIDFPWDILPMVRGHHERWDGTGYPDKLAGEQIALSARITCIADVYDALTTDRPYRRGFSSEDALAMMSADTGKMFDPALFPRFERLMRHEHGYQLPPVGLAVAG